jgi:hypothetical protein
LALPQDESAAVQPVGICAFCGIVWVVAESSALVWPDVFWLDVACGLAGSLLRVVTLPCESAEPVLLFMP